jgi:UTP--glucose-1-phosphate uridylyltransferase
MIRKAVIPVAGLGTRLLPLTKAVPKEMLPVGDKPVLEHTIRELVDSGIVDITIVTSTRKAAIQSHFAPDLELEYQLELAGKHELARSIRELSSLARINYLYQEGPYGNGTPILNAARIVRDEPFMVLWADDVFVAEVPRAQQLKASYEKVLAPVLALMPVKAADAHRYGVPIVEETIGEGLMRVSGLVEKPASQAPSGFAAIGGYVITPEIVDELERLTERWHTNRQGEIYLSDALNAYAAKHAVYGQVISGAWYDTGTPSSYLRAQFAFALAHPVYGTELRQLALGDES